MLFFYQSYLVHYLDVQRDPCFLENNFSKTAISRCPESMCSESERSCASLETLASRIPQLCILLVRHFIFFFLQHSDSFFLTLKLFVLIYGVVRGTNVIIHCTVSLSVYYKPPQKTLINICPSPNMVISMSLCPHFPNNIIRKIRIISKNGLFLCCFYHRKLLKCSYSLDMTVIFQWVSMCCMYVLNLCVC